MKHSGDNGVRGIYGEQATVVAVPAHNEAERIVRCVRALLDQRTLGGSRLHAGALKIVVLANNCTDGTADLVRAMGSEQVRVAEIAFADTQANAGMARRAAMDAAAAMLPDTGGLICTTDGDSRPRRDWIAHLWAETAQGAEAVAGAIDFDPQEGGAPSVSPRRPA